MLDLAGDEHVLADHVQLLVGDDEGAGDLAAPGLAGV
jgi:hypothetical protein